MTATVQPGKNNIALVSVCLAALMFGLEISSVPVILSTLEKELKGDFKEVQWIMNAYTIACTTVLMATGTLADKFGRKRIFNISIALFGITSLLCGLSQNMTLLIVSRFLQGMGGGAMLICSIAILSHQFREGRERGKAFASWGIISGIGLGFGPIIGGLIVAISNWQWVFLIHVIIAVITWVLVLRGVQESSDPHAKKLDLAGIISLSLAVFGLAYYITQGQDIGFTSIAGISIVAGVVISFLVFLRVEKINPHPMFDFSVFRIRRFSGAIIGCIGMNFSFWPFIIYFPIYFQSVLGYDLITAGLSMLAFTLPTLIMPPMAEKLSLRYQPRVVIPLGMVTIGLGFILMRYGMHAQDASWLTMLPGSLVAGIGLSLTNTPVTNTTTGSVPANRAGMASGIDISARLITLAVNIALMGFIFVEGILSYLSNAFAGAGHSISLRSLAGKIAAGNWGTLQQEFPALSSLDAENLAIRAALVNGFDWVILYAGIGVWVLALVSFLIFGWKEKGKPQIAPEYLS